MKTKVVFLDRDGCINEIRHDENGGLKNYVNTWDEFVWLPGAKEAIVKLLVNGYYVCIVSNQAGVGYGYMSKETLEDINTKMVEAVYQTLPMTEAKGELVEGSSQFYCCHTKETECSCRKPAPGMLYAAAYLCDLSLKDAWMVGDQLSDLKAGWNAGIRKLIHIGQPETNMPWKRNRLKGKPLPTLAKAVNFIVEYDDNT